LGTHQARDVWIEVLKCDKYGCAVVIPTKSRSRNACTSLSLSRSEFPYSRLEGVGEFVELDDEACEDQHLGVDECLDENGDVGDLIDHRPDDFGGVWTHSAAVNAATTSSSTASSKPTTSVGGVDAAATVTQSSATVTKSTVPDTNSLVSSTASSALTTAAVAVPAVTTAQVATPATGFVGLLNNIVTSVLNPFLAPAPSTPEPFSPVVWAVLGWVRRNLFNQSPTINPTTTVQTGQTVTGNLGATDPEGDALTYKVTQQPQHGTVTIDQATGKYTYTPDDINHNAAQTDSFTVSVTDGKFNLLSLFSPHSAKAGIDVTVLNPTVERVIVNLPASIKSPTNSRYAADGNSILFSAAPAAGGRRDIYQIDVDGTDLRCVTCGVSPNVTVDLVNRINQHHR
jgi:hypothetical protein